MIPYLKSAKFYGISSVYAAITDNKQ
jgi:hypothetical protein